MPKSNWKCGNNAFNRRLLRFMRFGIFELSRGGNPHQSETNLNQKTPETNLPGFSHFS